MHQHCSHHPPTHFLNKGEFLVSSVRTSQQSSYLFRQHFTILSIPTTYPSCNNHTREHLSNQCLTFIRMSSLTSIGIRSISIIIGTPLLESAWTTSLVISLKSAKKGWASTSSTVILLSGLNCSMLSSSEIASAGAPL